jgi:hypothetical protein
VAAVNRSARLITAALLVLGLGWAVAPRTALPLYDGIGFPDEPYRFVQRPAGAQETDPATAARGSAGVSGRTSDPLVAASDEVAPQVSLYIPKDRLDAPEGTTRIVITAVPAQPMPAGPGRYLWSNVYDVEAEPAATHLTTTGQQATITLRAASAQRPQPHIARYADGHWELLPTYAQGQDIYIAELTGFGKFAVLGSNPLLVTKLTGANAGSSGSGGSAVGLVVGIGAGVLVVVLFVVGRMRRARTRAAEDDAYDDDDDAEDEEAT